MTEHAPANTAARDHQPAGGPILLRDHQPGSRVFEHAPDEAPQGELALTKFGINNGLSNGHTVEWVGAKIVLDRTITITYNEEGAEYVADKKSIKEVFEKGGTPVLIIGVSLKYLATIEPAAFGAGVLRILKDIQTENPGKPVYYCELINEPYDCGEKGSNASDYALLCKAAYEALEGSGGLVKLAPEAGGWRLLCGAHLTYQKKISEKVAGEFSDWTLGHGWIKDMSETWPAMTEKVNGWNAHPYGEPGESTHEGNNGIRSTATQRTNLLGLGVPATNRGGQNFWMITEFGYNPEGVEGEFGFVKNTSEQSEKLKAALEEMTKWTLEGWLQGVLVFADGEKNWGIYGVAGLRPAHAMYKTWAELHGNP